MLRHLPERTTLIGRVRKDSVFYHPPTEQAQRGRKRKYGPRCPTPEQLLKDQSQPWQSVQAFAAAKRYDFHLKTLGPIFTSMDKGAHALRLVVLEPVPYRNSKKSKLQWYRRKPPQRATTNHLINQLRYEMWPGALKDNLTRFSSRKTPEQTPKNSTCLSTQPFFTPSNDAREPNSRHRAEARC